MVSGNAEPRLLDEDSVDLIDDCYVIGVDAVLNPYHNPRTNKKSLYVRTMYVKQDIEDDPFAHKYVSRED